MVAFKSILAAGIVAIALAFQPGAASACCGGVGADGYTRTWWRGTDGSISLWKLDPNFNAVASHVYGPYAGWWPYSLQMIGNNSYFLWRYTDGTASIWILDANLNYVTSSTFGPVAGWEPEGLGGDGHGNIRLLWHTPAHQVTAWVINAALTVIGSSPVYGPYFGWLY
jgi:hypothetical protein